MTAVTRSLLRVAAERERSAGPVPASDGPVPGASDPVPLALVWRMVAARSRSSALAACGSSSASSGPVTLNFYNFTDPSGAIQQAVNTCSAQSGGKYTISYNKLPDAADGQRQQMVRRLAAGDSSMDILGLDVTWEAEFAEAGWILPWTGTYKQQAIAGTLTVPLQTATWHGKLVAAPYNSNTQLLWYRSDLVPNPPKTWNEMLNDAVQLAKEGKPHLIEIQGAQYEGATVWFNTMRRQRGREHPHAGRAARVAGRARGPGADDHEAARHIRWRRTRRSRCRWRTRTGSPWRRARRRSN